MQPARAASRAARRATTTAPAASTTRSVPALGRRRAQAGRPGRLLAASAQQATTPAATGADTDQQRKRREALLRVVRDLYSTLYEFDDLSVDGLVSPGVTLEDDSLQVRLEGPQRVGDYLRWLHAGVDAGEPATATVDAAPLEKAVLAGAEAVLADEMAAAAKKAGFAIHHGGHEEEGGGAREDCVVATWVAGDDGEVRGRDEFFFDASAEASDPPIVRIHTSRVTAAAA